MPDYAVSAILPIMLDFPVLLTVAKFSTLLAWFRADT